MLFGREEHAKFTTKKINREILDCNNDLATHPNQPKREKKMRKRTKKRSVKKEQFKCTRVCMKLALLHKLFATTVREIRLHM